MPDLSANSYGSTIDLLNDVAEFLEGQADVRDGSDGPRPNKAMELMARAEIEIERLKRASLRGPEDEAVALLIELHKFLDFEVPLQPGDMEIESPEGINEVFAKAYALINSRDATPQHTKEDV
jgi:hypothetical protein